jgi:glucose/arabinose dehydrogenase
MARDLHRTGNSPIKPVDYTWIGEKGYNRAGNSFKKMLNTSDDPQHVLFGTFIVTKEAWLGISDIEVGPDGYLYIVSHAQGAIFRIMPRN